MKTPTLLGSRNRTVRAVRFIPYEPRKRGGAKYGPAPKSPPHPRMQAPAPMTPERRFEVYENLLQPGQHYYTRRQERQGARMDSREIFRRYREAGHG